MTLRAKRRTKRKRKTIPMVKNFDDMHTMSNANADATMHSFGVVTEGTQAIAIEIADYSKRSFEQGAKMVENLLSAKSLDKAMQVQSDYVKAAYEDYVACTTKLSELCANLAKEAFKPYEGLVGKMMPIK
jgi:hypothetical protein